MAVFLHIPFGDEDGSGWQCFFIYLSEMRMAVDGSVSSYTFRR